LAELGKYNQLVVTRRTANGVYLDGNNLGELLLPSKFVVQELEINDTVEVFVFKDSLGRLTATTEKPLAVVGEFAFLRVSAVTTVGAFLDWGLSKELLVPFKEQKRKMEEGRSYLVYLFVDPYSDRIAASSKLDQFLSKEQPTYEIGDEVSLHVERRTELGYSVIVNNRHRGMVFNTEVFRKLQIGEKTIGYVKKVRPDGKIDVIVDKPGAEKVNELEKIILENLHQNRGFLAVNDQSEPETIYDMFGVSKKTLKKAIGGLFKKRKIMIDDDGIRLIKDKESY